jgi:hypothetical protein
MSSGHRYYPGRTLQLLLQHVFHSFIIRQKPIRTRNMSGPPETYQNEKHVRTTRNQSQKRDILIDVTHTTVLLSCCCRRDVPKRALIA